MRGIWGIAVFLIQGFLFANNVQAEEFGTREEASAMVARVLKKFSKDGADATFKAVTAKAKEFNDRDLYPFIYDLSGLNVAHGARAELIGKNLIDFKDQNGKFLIREMIDVAKGSGSGWVDYRWTNPKTKKVEEKSAYIEKMGSYFVGVGVYRTEQVNQNTIAIISGSPNSDDTYLQVAYDLAAVLNDGDKLRILPVVGIGGSQNIRDVLTLKGIDLGLTQVSVLNNFRRSNQLLGVNEDKIVYVAKLFNQEVHIVARSDVQSIQQLEGKKVNFDEIGSGTNYAMRDIFKRLNIKVEEVNVSQVDAFEKLGNGTIAATALVAGKPSKSLAALKPGTGFRFLSIPYSNETLPDYLPATLTSQDYPSLIAAGNKVSTIADSVVLISYNWPKAHDRYRRVQTFVEAFFAKIGDFQKPPRHPKWREANIAARLPGWVRFEAGEAWLLADRAKTPPALQSEFNQFLNSPQGQSIKKPAATASADETEELFRNFLKWRDAEIANRQTR